MAPTCLHFLGQKPRALLSDPLYLVSLSIPLVLPWFTVYPSCLITIPIAEVAFPKHKFDPFLSFLSVRYSLLTKYATHPFHSPNFGLRLRSLLPSWALSLGCPDDLCLSNMALVNQEPQRPAVLWDQSRNSGIGTEIKTLSVCRQGSCKAAPQVGGKQKTGESMSMDQKYLGRSMIF